MLGRQQARAGVHEQFGRCVIEEFCLQLFTTDISSVILQYEGTGRSPKSRFGRAVRIGVWGLAVCWPS